MGRCRLLIGGPDGRMRALQAARRGHNGVVRVVLRAGRVHRHATAWYVLRARNADTHGPRPLADRAGGWLADTVFAKRTRGLIAPSAVHAATKAARCVPRFFFFYWAARRA